MNPIIKRELVSAQATHARTFSRIEALRTHEAAIETIMALRSDRYWSFWADGDGIYIGLSVDAESIMFDSEVAELLSGIEAILGGDFVSSVTRDGDVEYRLEAPGFGRAVITANLTEAGTCRKVVTGFERKTVYHSVEVEEAVPVYGISCGEGASA